MRIAVLHLGWPIQAFMRDMINGLAQSGHRLTLIASDRDQYGMVDLGTLLANVEMVTTSRTLSLLYRKVRARLADVVAGDAPLHGPLTRFVVEQALERHGPFDLLVGVEKAGLDLATWVGERKGIPVAYYSLELYVEDHPRLSDFAWQRPRERVCHARACGTVIQDRHRWDALRVANDIGEQPTFFLPVGVLAQPGPRKCLAQAPLTLLSLGVQSPSRYSHELVETARAFPGDLALWLHGPVYHPATAQLARGPLPPTVRFSTSLVPESALPGLLRRADIGLALYRTDYVNDRLTAYASQRVAQYLQFGLPVIAFRSAAYDDLFSRFHCGDTIADLSELANAARRIMQDYPRYSAGAQTAFAEVYRLDRYWPRLAEFFETCASRPPRRT